MRTVVNIHARFEGRSPRYHGLRSSSEPSSQSMKPFASAGRKTAAAPRPATRGRSLAAPPELGRTALSVSFWSATSASLSWPHRRGKGRERIDSRAFGAYKRWAMANPIPQGGAAAAEDPVAAGAIRRYEERLGRGPAPLAFAPLGGAYPQAGRARGVILQSSPKDAQAHRLTAEIHRRAGRWEEARQHLERVVKLDAGDRESRLLLQTLGAEGRAGDGSPRQRGPAGAPFAT